MFEGPALRRDFTSILINIVEFNKPQKFNASKNTLLLC